MIPFNMTDNELPFIYPELHLQSRERQTVYTLRVPLVGGAGVLGQHSDKGSPVRLWDQRQPRLRQFHRKPPFRALGRKAPHRLRMAVSVGQIGLDIVNGCAVHQISPPDMEHRPQPAAELHPLQPDAGQAKGLGLYGERGANTPSRWLPPSRGGVPWATRYPDLSRKIPRSAKHG